MKLGISLTSLLIPGLLVVACGSDDDVSSGAGGTSAGGSGGTSTGGSAGATTGGSAGAAGTGVTCDEVCIHAAPFQCSKGSSASDCIDFCEDTLEDGEATCAAAMDAVLKCETVLSDMSCDDDGYVTSTECATEWTALNPCLPPA